MELNEESIDVEFDSEFMRLYYDQIRTGPSCILSQTTNEKKNSQIHREERGSLGNIGQIERLRCIQFRIPDKTKNSQRHREKRSSLGNCKRASVKRQYNCNFKEARPMEVAKSMKVVDLDSTTKKPKELSLVELSALKSRNSIFKTRDRKKLFLNSKLTYKSTMLQERSPAFLRMVCSHTGIQIDIFDGNSAPVLNKQIIKVGSSHTVVRFQVIKEIIMREIGGKDEIRIPQIITCNDDMKIFLCPLKECTEGFLHSNVAKNHALSHLDLRPFSCNFFGCGWTFAKENHLQRHLATHENTKNYSCDVPGCDKVFTTIYNLNEHRKKRHIQPATKPCPVLTCKETFRNDKELRTHCKQHNHRDAPLKCVFTECKRTFFFKSTLEAHTKTHLEENQHICTYNNCNKNFQQAYRLKEHMRCHTGAKPYKCTIGKCTKAFSTASKLKRHEISHFDDKHHYCNIEGCDKAFKRSDHLNEHIRQVHKGVTQGGQKALTLMRPETSETEPSPFIVNGSIQIYNCTETVSQPKTETSGQSTSRCHTITSEDEETDLSNYLAFNPYSSSMPGCSKTEDELLDEAIKSLGVPEMKLETDLFLDEPLDLSDFSTVNLRDLH